MEKIQLLSQMNYSISLILQRENKLIQHKEKLETFKGKPFYETLQSGIEQIEKEIRSEKETLRLYLKDYEIFLYS